MPNVNEDRGEADPSNDLFISAATLNTGRRVVTPSFGIPFIITSKQMAYRAAAWIKVYGDLLPDEPLASTFEEVEQAVRKS